MERVFSSLWGFARSRWQNAFGMANAYHPIENIASKEDEDAIQSQDYSINGNIFEQFDRNQGENQREPLNESTNAIAFKNDIKICSARFVKIGNNSTINFHKPVRKMETIRVVCATVDPGKQALVDEESQVSTLRNNVNIISDIVVLGDGNKIYVQNIDRMFLVDLRKNVQEILLFPLTTEFFQRLPSPRVDSQLQRLFDIMAEIINLLYPLRDQGKWQEFEEAVSKLRLKYGHYPVIKCFLLLEESIQFTYQNKLKRAKKFAQASINIANNELNGASQDVLRVLGNVALASIFRRQPKKKIGKAFKCLEKAKESGERLKEFNLTIPNFTLALLNYEQGRCYMEFATMKGDSQCLKREARKFLGFSMDRCRQLSDKNQLYTARQSFALIYLARLSITAYQSEPAQRQMIKKQSARQARKHLKEYDRSHSHVEDTPVAARIKYLTTQSELCFLEKNYSSAEKHACLALEIAQEYGFQLETVPAQDNIDHICRHCAPITTHAKLQVKNISSSYTCSSSTTTDSDGRAS